VQPFVAGEYALLTRLKYFASTSKRLLGEGGRMPSDNGYPCELCQRLMREPTTLHHLIPRVCHRNQWFQKRFSREEMQQTIALCKDCHRAIHRLVPSEKELGRHHDSIERLLSHAEIAKFVRWIKKQR